MYPWNIQKWNKKRKSVEEMVTRCNIHCCQFHELMKYGVTK